jgi:peptide/nickel transport system substrate-binding protein
MPLLLIFMLLLSGCFSSRETNPNAVTVAVDSAPANLDPRIGIDAASTRIYPLIFNGLVKTTDDFSVQPDLATSWENPDPTTYIFHLRENVTFHDGRPLTAKDVVYTYESVMKGELRTQKVGTYRPLESVSAPDSSTVVFKLKDAFPSFLLNIARDGVLPEGSPADFARNPIGSGPFKFVHYFQDQEVLLARNDSYYGEKPHVEAVTLRIIPEAIVRALELRKGSIDIAPNVLPPDMVETLKDDNELEVAQGPGTNYRYLAFNLKDPIFSNVLVRRAIAHAVDREKIAKYLFRDQVRLSSSVIPANNWAYAPDLPVYSYDPALAKQLLKEAGHADLSFTYRTTTEETNRLLAAVLQQQFRDAGINMDLRSNEAATFFADIGKGNFQMYSATWVGGNNYPDDMLNLIFHSTMTPPNGANRGFYSNPEVDGLIDFARRESDQEKRKEAYGAIQHIVARDLPYVSLWYNDVVCIYNKRISNVKLSPTGDYQFLTAVRVNASTD